MAMWQAHRRRAEVLRERYPFAAEVLTLYLAILDVWEEGQDPLPGVLKAIEANGPPLLAQEASGVAEIEQDCLVKWHAGQELTPVERFLARACTRPYLEADASACDADPAARGGRNCPRCGGLPQLSYRMAGGDPLVSGQRQLLCARCGHSWNYSASACPACGETKPTIYADRDIFPHLRIDACGSCKRYLIDVDLGRDGRAVPEVDELAALPLDLYAAEQGLSKVTPNLMGF